MKRYLVAWSGGYEPPIYQVFFSEEEAMKQAKDWWDMSTHEEGDWIDVLEIDVIANTVARIESPDREPDEEYV